MGVFYEQIPESLRTWILTQKLFWVATAPLAGSGHVNVSPKGGQYFGVLDARTFWYMDLTGSGSETLAHLHEPGNSRITVMFNAFEGAPKIVRLWGHGRVLENGTNDFSQFVLNNKVETIPGSRSIIIVDIHQVGSSCGFSVPFYDFKNYRKTLNEHFAKLDAKYQESGEVKDSMDHYWAYKNSWSVDGLPSMKRANIARKKYSVTPLEKMVGPLALTSYQAGLSFSFQSVILIALMSFLIGLALAVYTPAIITHFGLDLSQAHSSLKVVNLTHVPYIEELAGLWTTK